MILIVDAGNTTITFAAVSEENEELADEVYNTKWECVDEAFKEIFGISRNELYNE
jgi:pantothenate kinase type III